MATGNLHFTLDIDGDRELSRKLHGYLGRVTDLQPFFENVAADWSETMAKKFAAEGAAEGESAWPPLSARYAAWKAKKHPGQKILVRTGRLRAAATTPETNLTAQQLRLTINVPYAIYHQSSRARTGPLPRRAFASLTGKQKSRWVRLLRKRIWDEGADG